MKKETNRHRLDYWAPVLPSSPPSSHVLVVIQRKNGATYYTQQTLTKIDNASEHGAWHIKNITNNYELRSSVQVQRPLLPSSLHSSPRSRKSSPHPPSGEPPSPPATSCLALNSALSFSSSLLSLLPTFHPSTTRFETTVTGPNRRGRGSHQKL